MTPLISVVIPVYNRTWELKRALDALLAQTSQDFEVIVCDDGSTENVHAIVDNFTESLRLTYRRIENSGGPARPRNVATGFAKGEWISFLDSDDWWDPDRMATVAHELHGNVDLLYHSLRFVAPPGKSSRRGLRRTVGHAIHGEPLRYMALFGNPIPNSAAIVRRSMLDRVGGMCEDKRLVAYEDFDTWLHIAESGAHIRFLDRVLGSYWLGDDSISVMSERQIERQIALFNRHISKWDPELRREAQACHDLLLGSMWSRVDGKTGRAYEHLRRARDLPTMTLRVKRLMRLALATSRGL